ncbi:unnamed protein product [marine sediment metagenome]|uniref:Uncharacterized protein n=1 Tax=marine sediment metagenome TaxID=412755 RepID=X1M902_9ZZZZ
MDRNTLIREGKHTEFWKIICEEIDRRIEGARNQLETQSNTEMVKRLQFAIGISREFKKLPDDILRRLRPQGEKRG